MDNPSGSIRIKILLHAQRIDFETTIEKGECSMNIHELKRLYLEEGYSLNKAAQTFNTTPYLIKKTLVQNGIRPRTRSEQNILTNQQRGLKVNHQYFDNIDNNKKAYILGFLSADGSVHNGNRNTIGFGLSSVDRELLEKIKEELEVERPIQDFVTNTGFPVSRLFWSSANHKIKLANYDIIPNKTYHKISMEKIPEEFKFSYLLGYYDGDGCFRNDGNSCRTEICAYRPELLEEFALLVNEKFGSKNAVLKAKSRDNYYTLTYATNYSVPLLNFLYETNDLFLKRKYDAFLAWKSNSRIK